MTTPRTLRAATALALASSLIVAAGCGSDSEKSDSTKETTTTAKDSDATTDESTVTDDTTDDSGASTDAVDLAAWLSDATDRVEKADSACAVVEVLDEDADFSPLDDDTARQAGVFFADAYERLADLTPGLSDDSKSAIKKLAGEIRDEASSDDLDVESYIENGPSMVDNEEFTAALTEMMGTLTTECTPAA